MTGWRTALAILAPIILGGPLAGVVIWLRNGRPETGVLRINDTREVHDGR